MSHDPAFDLSAIVLGTPDVAGLLAFYRDLLGWEVRLAREEWAVLIGPGGAPKLCFQHEPDHVRPSWPADDGDQQMQVHLDLAVDDMGGAVARAVMLGASLAEQQPQDDVRVLFDPAGHPFCLFVAQH